MRKPVFNYHELSFQASAGIKEYARLFSDVPALVPSDMIYDLKTRTWNLKFRIYHPAILPLGA